MVGGDSNSSKRCDNRLEQQYILLISTSITGGLMTLHKVSIIRTRGRCVFFRPRLHRWEVRR